MEQRTTMSDSAKDRKLTPLELDAVKLVAQQLAGCAHDGEALRMALRALLNEPEENAPEENAPTIIEGAA
jgi:hypothetical protein